MLSGVNSMSDSRLRRLDALFAEKVLGCTSNEHGCGCPTRRHGIWNEGSMEHFSEFPPYTRSLDAAWEGAVQLKTDVYIESPMKDHLCDAICRIGIDWGDMGWEYQGIAPHPAEALVLACLRAVGVEEEELV
jgi:hypothetical protein